MFDSQMLPLIAACVIVAAILIPCIALFIVYRRYKKLAKTLPSPFTIQQDPVNRPWSNISRR